MSQKDGIHKLYHPHIADQIPEGASRVNDVVDRLIPVPAMSAALTDAEIDGMKIDLYIPGYLTGFMLDIDRMNGMYELGPIENTLTRVQERIDQFKSILTEECAEIDDIKPMLELGKDWTPARVALADLLGDIMVYCASEAKRWGIPIDKVLNIIMQSNFSKLGDDGKPIKDERGKFLKGPNYWKPEPKIAELLAGVQNANN